MKKVILLLILLIFITGCSDLMNKIPSKLPGLDFGDSSSNKLLGPSGNVLMEIYYPSEKGQVEKTFDFSPTVKVQNTGSSDSTGQVCISALDKNVFGGFGGSSGCDCLTYTYNYLPDEKFQMEVLTFGPYSITSDENLLRNDFTVTAVNRFTYTSKAYFRPCIRSDFDMTNCGTSILEKSNGPIAINSIDEILTSASGNNVNLAFKIGLRDSGSGMLISQRDVNAECSVASNTNTKKIKPKITGVIEDFPFLGNVRCEDATLDKKEGQMNCVVGQVDMFDASGNYRFSEDVQTPLKLTLTYAYQDIKTNKFTVGSTRYV